MYTVFLILHIICSGCWISILFANISVGGVLKKSVGTLGELYLMRALIAVGSVMGNIGGIGILITGSVITGMDHKGWFPFGTLNWLACKQVIFIVLLGMTFGVMVPRVKKARRMIAEELAGASPTKGASVALRKLIMGIMPIGMVMNVLVLLNIILGTWKPNF